MTPCDSTVQETLVSLDPDYVKDLQTAFASDMIMDLQKYAGPLDGYVKEQVSSTSAMMLARPSPSLVLLFPASSSQELKCARLMTMLQPIYVRAKMVIPHPTRAKALTAFPLDMSRPTVTEATLDSARQVLSKVRQGRHWNCHNEDG